MNFSEIPRCGKCKLFRITYNSVPEQPYGKTKVKLEEEELVVDEGACTAQNIAGVVGGLGFKLRHELSYCKDPSKFEPIERTSVEILMVPPSQEGLVFEA